MATEESSNTPVDGNDGDGFPSTPSDYFTAGGGLLALGAVGLFLFNLVTGHGLTRSVTLHLIGVVIVFLGRGYDAYVREEEFLRGLILYYSLIFGIYGVIVAVAVFVLSVGAAQDLATGVFKLTAGAALYGILIGIFMTILNWGLALLMRIAQHGRSATFSPRFSSIPEQFSPLSLKNWSLDAWSFPNPSFLGGGLPSRDQTDPPGGSRSLADSLEDMDQEEWRSIVSKLDEQFAAACETLADGNSDAVEQFEVIHDSIEQLISTAEGEVKEANHRSLTAARNQARHGYVQARLLQLAEWMAAAEERFHSEEYADAEREFTHILHQLSDLETQLADGTAPIVDIADSFADVDGVDEAEVETLNEVVAAFRSRCTRFKTSANSIRSG